MKDLDEELSLRIKSVFENYDDGAQDSGWALLREKFPEKSSKRSPLWWFSGVAACMLLFAGYWVVNNQQEMIVKGNHKPALQNQNLTAKELPKKNDQSVNYQNQLNHEKTNRVSINPLPANEPEFITQKPKEDYQILNPGLDKPQTSLIVKPDVIIASVPANQKDSTVSQNNQTAVKTEVIAAIPQVKKTTEEFLMEQSKLAKNQASKKEKSGSKNSLEVFTGTFFNYAGNNEAKVNAGFGLNANIQVSKSLTLSVGAGISQNKLSYDGNSFGSQDKVNEPSAMMSFSPEKNNSLVALSYTSVEKTVSAKLINLDLPIVLKFYPTKKQNFYISTGINSSSYLAQQYDFNYKLTNQNTNGGQPTFYEETEKSKLNGFDFANSAIFAIGVNQKIGKGSNLIFEPYFKPAIGYMGANKLRINTAGVNLKFSFNSRSLK